MIFVIEKDALYDGLSKTAPIAERKSPLPILSQVLIEAGEKGLVLTATDLEVGLQLTYDCDVKEAGIATVAPKRLFEFVRELPSGPISCEMVEGGRLRVASGVSVIELAGMDPADYPAWSAFEEVDQTPVEAKELLFMIDKTMFASSNDDARFNLNGVLFERNEEKTRLVATDGHRLALTDGEVNLALEVKVLVPKKSLTELRRVLENIDGEVLLGFDKKNMVIGSEKFRMTLRLIDGDYPDYRKVVPEAGDVEIHASRQGLVQTMKRVAVLTSDRNRGINVTVKSGKMEFKASHPDLGTARDEVEVEYEGDEFEIIINVSYLIEALGIVDTEKISLEYSLEGGPIIIRPIPPKNYFNLVMPMRK